MMDALKFTSLVDPDYEEIRSEVIAKTDIIGKRKELEKFYKNKW